MTRRLRFLVILFSAISAITAHASVPVGVYGIVDKVVLEPAGAEPQRAQIRGTFALWDEAAGLGYRTPQRGTSTTAVRESNSASVGTSGQT